MAKRTHSDIRDMVEAILGDSDNAIWSTTDLDLLIIDALFTMSEYVPLIIRETLTTTASSRDLDLSSLDVPLGVRELEFRVDKTPKVFRNFKIRGDLLTMDIDFLPAADESVYLYCEKVHRLNAMTDLLGQVDSGNDGYDAGDATMTIDNFTTDDEVIKELTRFTIAGDTTVYKVTADATVSGNQATVSFTPALVADAAENAVVTFETSTLSPVLERLLSELVAASAAKSVSLVKINLINKGGRGVAAGYITWGKDKYNETIEALEAEIEPDIAEELPRGA